ncbi:GDP-L-fucose synthase [Streptomyces sp. T-3]|nr:GDP-L-fucose synthase [Streptomyces sp. T-3]
MESRPLSRTARVHIAGHRGLVGSALVRHFTEQGFGDLLLRSSAVTDLRDRDAVRRLYATERPHVVVLAAARVGGIAANAARPVDFLSDNLRIQLNVLDAAHEFGVERLLFLGSSCIYPKHAPQPIPESALLTGPLEPTNDAYAIAKISGILHIQALRRQYGLPYISAMPTNLYGPGDNLDPRTSHVVPAMLQRTHEAHIRRASRITHWGTGTPRREFLHVDDLARACLFLLENYDGDAPVNVGTGEDLELRELAALVARTVGYQGTVDWDATRPDGTPRKLLDTRLLNGLGWKPEISLPDGLAQTYAWLRAQTRP